MAIAFVVCNALHPLATEYGAPDGQAAWPWRTSVPAAAALVWRPAAAIGYTVFAVAVASLANAHGLGQSDIFDYVQYFVRGLGSSTVFAWVVISALTATALLDSESSIAERSAAIAAAGSARSRARPIRRTHPRRGAFDVAGCLARSGVDRAVGAGRAHAPGDQRIPFDDDRAQHLRCRRCHRLCALPRLR